MTLSKILYNRWPVTAEIVKRLYILQVKYLRYVLLNCSDFSSKGNDGDTGTFIGTLLEIMRGK